MRTPTIERRHHTHLRVLKQSHHMRQILRRNPDIAVIDQHMAVARLRKHLRQIADFAVRAQHFRSDYQADGNFRKFRLELLDGGDRRVFQATDAEKDLVFARILLPAMADKTRIHVVIKALEWLQNADGRTISLCTDALSAHKGAGAPQRNEIKSHPAERKDGRDAFNNDGEHECSVYKDRAHCPTHSAGPQWDRGLPPSTPDKSQTPAQSGRTR